MIDKNKKMEILEGARRWFREVIAKNHIRNTLKLTNPKEFNIHPFLASYLANFLSGNSNPTNIAKALVYPRVLGTSITTSFGQNIQSFTSVLLDAFGSTTSGIDIEFIDQVDGYKKYCQLKSGPNTINKDDVETIAEHFKGVINLARTNNKRIPRDDMIVGVVYGTKNDLSSHYRRITYQYDYPVYAGEDFWLRLTGDSNFYHDLIEAIGSVALESDFSSDLEYVIKELSETEEIKKLSNIM
ncbi:PmeII family type II restriction endonuclease [Alteromonas sp. ASW11-19]|uniref:PmeII family type II restriction endonuclease n=1 Tax=Alteromonas salexigens TaxID=2982530 RepID=A0ABT2VNW3_9ALTE|nr:PmeII family type II restriction endonuclease [Alteromonas salexigens]MCU7554784.1 PmeII family type II restriction endonuclease [Alteromonas salexigens]